MTCKFDDGEDDFIADIQTCFRLTVVYKTGSDRHTISPTDIVQSCYHGGSTLPTGHFCNSAPCTRLMEQSWDVRPWFMAGVRRSVS